MSNHYHLVLKVNNEAATALSDDEVVSRWTAVYTSGDDLVKRYQAGETCGAESEKAKDTIAEWRVRLSSISWFMSALNQYISRRANQEDKCKGHFWESRFKSQALLDEMALLACMVYVDLNPVRAGIAKGLEDSDFTSIQERLKVFMKAKLEKAKAKKTKKHRRKPARYTEPSNTCGFQPKALLPFTSSQQGGIPFSLMDYLALVQNTGRIIDPRKKGYIEEDQLNILDSLDITEDVWLEMVQNFEGKFSGFAGKAELLYFHANRRGMAYYTGVG